jgi:hypothetical protein
MIGYAKQKYTPFLVALSLFVALISLPMTAKAADIFAAT